MGMGLALVTAAPGPATDPVPRAIQGAFELFHHSNVLRLAVPFVLVSLLLVVAKGPRALRLSDETLRSVIVTLTLLAVNGYLAAYLVLRVDVTSGGFGLVGLPSLSAQRWDSVPWPLTVLAVLFLFDLADYWAHRLMHNSPLWGVHAVHHSDHRMNWLTSSRVHVFEVSVVKLGYLVLLGWVGLPLWSLAGANAIAYMHNRYVHADLGWNHGPLTRVIASPNQHRWHHSVDPKAYNRNYANIFAFIDVVFGTYYNPGPCNTDVGLREIPRPTAINQLLYPFSYLLQQLQAAVGRRTESSDLPASMHRQEPQRTDSQTAAISSK